MTTSGELAPFEPNWTAIVSAVVTIASAASIAAGHPALGALFNDPNTATVLTGALAAFGGLFSSLSHPVYQSK